MGKQSLDTTGLAFCDVFMDNDCQLCTCWCILCVSDVWWSRTESVCHFHLYMFFKKVWIYFCIFGHCEIKKDTSFTSIIIFSDTIQSAFIHYIILYIFIICNVQVLLPARFLGWAPLVEYFTWNGAEVNWYMMTFTWKECTLRPATVIPGSEQLYLLPSLSPTINFYVVREVLECLLAWRVITVL